MRSGEINTDLIPPNKFGYLKGFFIGDGYKFHDLSGRKFYTEFYLNSERDNEISSFILKTLRSIKLNPQTYKDKRYSCIRIRINNKKFYSYFNKNYKKMNLPKEEIIGFISGFLDAEGYVNNEKNYIVITNTDKKVLEFIKRKLSSFSVHSTLKNKWKSEKMKKNSYNLYISVKFKSIPHLSIKA